ncbi:MAG: hypothetical protein AAGE52_11025 [Myxococcota bacterium]
MLYRFWTEDPSCIVGAFWDHMPSASVRDFHQALRAHQQMPATQRSCLGYVKADTVVSRRALSAIGDFLSDPEIDMDAWVCCIAGTGFWAATGRGMASSVMLVTSTRAPVKITSTVSESMRWLSERGHPTPTSNIEEALAEVSF